MTAPDPEYVALKTQLAQLDADDPAAAAIAEELHTVYLGLLRGATTPAGYPYPDPTDPIAEGADAIRALAEALTSRTVEKITTAGGPVGGVTAPTSSYPEGWSIFGLSAAQSAAGGWNRPQGGSYVLTFRVLGSTATLQIQFRGANDINYAFVRGGNSNGWSVWRNLSAPYGIAHGTVTLPSATASGGVTTATVTFPSGVFPTAPNVTTNSRTSVPSQRATVAGSITTTSFVVTFQNLASTASGTNSDWIAVLLDGPQNTAAARESVDAGPAEVVTVTCPTPGCPNEGIPIEATLAFVAEDGGIVTVDQVICGSCSTVLLDESETGGA